MASASTRFSNDILLSIFFFTTYTVATVVPPLPYPYDAKRSISHVCSKWRNIVLQTPTLWTSYHLYFNSTPLTENAANMIVTWLRRSMGMVIDIRLIDTTSRAFLDSANQATCAYEIMYEDRTINVIRCILQEFSTKIRSFVLTMQTYVFLKTFIDISTSTFPLLESLDITFVDDFIRRETLSADSELPICFEGLPSLREAAVHTLNGIPFLTLQLPWGRLIALNLLTIATPPTVFMTIVQASPNLVQGQFHIEFNEAADIFDICNASGRSLEVLRLRLMYPSKYQRIFQIISLPVIRHLRIDLYDPSRGWDTSLIVSMLKDSSDTLKSLMLADYPPPPLSPEYIAHIPRCGIKGTFYADLDDLLNATPGLRGLYLPFRLPIHRVTMEKIATGSLLPCLEEISLCCVALHDLLSIVERRNSNREYFRRLPSSSGISDHNREISSICSLIVAVPAEEKEAIDEAWGSLRLLPHMTSTVVEIFGEDMRYFQF